MPPIRGHILFNCSACSALFYLSTSYTDLIGAMMDAMIHPYTSESGYHPGAQNTHAEAAAQHNICIQLRLF